MARFTRCVLLSFCLLTACAGSDSDSGSSLVSSPNEQPRTVRDASATTTENQDAAIPAPVDCATNSDCQLGFVCESGQCAPGDAACAVDEDCADGERCTSGRCEAVDMGCSDDIECGLNQVCRDGECQPTAAGCGMDADCRPGERCLNGQCRADQAACQRDLDCPAGQSCQNGECVMTAGGCRNDNECGPNADCVNGECVPTMMADCRVDADCPPGMDCRNGQCIPAQGQMECADNFDCPAGESCVNDRCVPAQGGGECQVNADCAAGLLCLNGVCDLPPGFGEACLLDSDCQPNLVCVFAVCIPDFGGEPECVGDGDCPGDRVCDGGQCRDPEPPPEDCAFDADCDVGQVCQNGACVNEEAPECVVDADCLNGDACQGGRCLPRAACRDAVPIRLDMPIAGSTADGVRVREAPCADSGSPEVIHQFTALNAGTVCVTTAGSLFDTVLYVIARDCVAGEVVACNDDDNFGIAEGTRSAVEFEVEARADYFIVVDGYGANSSGDYQLEVRDGPCLGPPPPPPPSCLDAGEVSVGEAVQGSTVDGPENLDGGCAGNGPEAVYRFGVPFDTQICATTSGSNFDTVLYVRQDQCVDGQEVICNDDGGLGLTSQVSFQALGNTDYYIIIDSFRLGGDYQLQLFEGNCP